MGVFAYIFLWTRLADGPCLVLWPSLYAGLALLTSWQAYLRGRQVGGPKEQVARRSDTQVGELLRRLGLTYVLLQAQGQFVHVRLT